MADEALDTRPSVPYSFGMAPSVDGILSELSWGRGYFPEEALRAALERGDENFFGSVLIRERASRLEVATGLGFRWALPATVGARSQANWPATVPLRMISRHDWRGGLGAAGRGVQPRGSRSICVARTCRPARVRVTARQAAVAPDPEGRGAGRRVISAQTAWQSYPYLGGSSPPPALVEAVDQYDGIGRQVLERFKYIDALVTKDLAYGYAKSGGGEDAALRRSMLTSAGFTVGTTPDGAGKLASMTLSGPGIAGQQPLADWRYEGNRPIWRAYVPGAATGPTIETESVYNQLRHMTQITTTRFVSGVGTQVYDLHMERDVEGNVLQHRYAKVSGKAGDWFQLDGWDRLQEAKLGVLASDFAGSYAAASFDHKITYALDEAHNRVSVSEDLGSSTSSTTYNRRSDTNEYEEVIIDGDAQKWLYDDNGNVLSDGYYLYVYDHLDRLSEVYLLTYPGGATTMTASGQETVQVFGKEPQSKRNGRETQVPRSLWKQQVLAARQRVAQARQAAGTPQHDPRPPMTANANTTGTSVAAVNESMPLLIALYGYDPSNRRIGKMLGDGSSTFFAWSGWDLIESYDSFFLPSAVYYEGGVIDEHLGYSWRNPSTGAWTRYGYVQEHARGTNKVVDHTGSVVEQSDYDPFGRAQMSTVPGQIYGFAGRQVDIETGLLYYRNRYYQPGHGRFLSGDPWGLWGDRFAVGNPYSYAASAPIAKYDPLGLWTSVIVVTSPPPRGADEQAEFDNAMEAAENTASSDPEGGEIVVVYSANDGGEVGSGKSVEGPMGARTPPAKRKKHKLVVVLHHGMEEDVGLPLATDYHPTHGNMVIEDLVKGPGVVYDNILVSACWLASKPRADAPELLRRNMAYRLAMLDIGPVYGFCGRVLRKRNGQHLLPDETPNDADDNPTAEPVAVHPPK